MRVVGVNYANKRSDTNLDGDSVREKLAEGGIVRMVEVVAAGASLHPRSLPSGTSLSYLPPFFFFFK